MVREEMPSFMQLFRGAPPQTHSRSGKATAISGNTTPALANERPSILLANQYASPAFRAQQKETKTRKALANKLKNEQQKRVQKEKNIRKNVSLKSIPEIEKRIEMTSENTTKKENEKDFELSILRKVLEEKQANLYIPPQASAPSSLPSNNNVQRMLNISANTRNIRRTTKGTSFYPRTYKYVSKQRYGPGKKYVSANEIASRRNSYKFPLVNTSNMTPRTSYDKAEEERMEKIGNQQAKLDSNFSLALASKESGQEFVRNNDWLAEKRRSYKFPLVNTSNMTPRTSYTDENIEEYKKLINPLANVAKLHRQSKGGKSKARKTRKRRGTRRH
jgi:hypothetical protein